MGLGLLLGPTVQLLGSFPEFYIVVQLPGSVLVRKAVFPTRRLAGSRQVVVKVAVATG